MSISRMVPLNLKSYQEDRKERGVYDKRNRINDLTGKEWIFSTKTVIPRSFSPNSLFSPYNLPYSPLPFELVQDLISTFSKPNESILDPFAGIGAILFANNFENRGNFYSKRIITGIESNQSHLAVFYELKKKFPNFSDKIIEKPHQDAFNLLKNEQFELILTELPIRELYSYFPKLDFHQIHKWIMEKEEIFKKAIHQLRVGKYFILMITLPHSSDNFLEACTQSNFYFSIKMSSMLDSLGLIMKSERIWFNPQTNGEELPLIPLRNRILIFRKEVGPFSVNHSPKIPFFSGKTFVIHKAFPPSFNHDLRREHGGMKPPELAYYLIENFSQDSSDLILDPFAGVGGTLLGGSIAKKSVIGIDINPRWKEIYENVSNTAGFPLQRYIIGDSRKVVSEVIADNSIDLVLTDVPYWAMDKLKKTRGRFSRAGEPSGEKLHSSLKQFDDSTVQSIEEWLELLTDVFRTCYCKLKLGKYIIVFIGNMYRTFDEQIHNKNLRRGRYLFLSGQLALLLDSLGFEFERELIWYSPDKSLHVFGYPYSYIPSIVHQTILVFKKP